MKFHRFVSGVLFAALLLSTSIGLTGCDAAAMLQKILPILTAITGALGGVASGTTSLTPTVASTTSLLPTTTTLATTTLPLASGSVVLFPTSVW